MAWTFACQSCFCFSTHATLYGFRKALPLCVQVDVGTDPGTLAVVYVMALQPHAVCEHGQNAPDVDNACSGAVWEGCGAGFAPAIDRITSCTLICWCGWAANKSSRAMRAAGAEGCNCSTTCRERVCSADIYMDRQSLGGQTVRFVIPASRGGRETPMQSH
jgi:hypothetical protein